MKRLLLAFLIMASYPVLAQTYVVQCGAFKLEAIPGAMNKINGQTVTSQKIKMLGKDGTGMKIDMGLMPARDGNNYGFQYIHRPGTDSRFLNVQLLQASMDAPRIIGSFSCVKVAD